MFYGWGRNRCDEITYCGMGFYADICIFMGINIEDHERWLDPAEAGKLIPGGLGAPGVRQWCRQGKLPGAVKLPSGRWQIPVSALNEVLQKGVSGG